MRAVLLLVVATFVRPLYAQEPAPAPRPLVVTLGDSITKGVRTGVRPGQTFAAILQEKLGRPVRNVGIGGERTDQALKRLHQIIAAKPRFVTVMYGTNDSYVDKGKRTNRITAQAYRQNLARIVTRLRDAGIEPILMTEPRWAADAGPNGRGEHPNIELERYMQVCRAVSRANRVLLVDHFADWTDAERQGQNLRDWTTDGCHPNGPGHARLAERILPVLNAALAAEPVRLWAGPDIPPDVERIPFPAGVRHQTIHRATESGYRFLHGAAIVHYRGTLFANWANSPTNENGPLETLQGRRSTDSGRTWTEPEVIGPGFEGPDRHSHGVYFVHNEELWTICSRFGVGEPAKRFPGLKAEAFVLNADANAWESRGIVMHNCWPYDEPVRMANGSFITGGQDKDGLPVVAISRGTDVTRWDTVAIPYDPRLQPSFAETTVMTQGQIVIAIIRGGQQVAWVSRSADFGRTWSRAAASNLPMPRAKAYVGRLSTGQMFLLSNLGNRDTLVLSVSRPGEDVLRRMWRVRSGKSVPPRFPGRAKSKQWSYPYAHEHAGNLYIVYSIGKEDCGLSVVPVASLVAKRR